MILRLESRKTFFSQKNISNEVVSCKILRFFSVVRPRSHFAETLRDKNTKKVTSSPESYPFIQFFMCNIQCIFIYVSLLNIHFVVYNARRTCVQRPFALATGVDGHIEHSILAVNAPQTSVVRQSVASD